MTSCKCQRVRTHLNNLKSTLGRYGKGLRNMPRELLHSHFYRERHNDVSKPTNVFGV